MVIKYLFLITFIYKSFEVRLPIEDCGVGKYYNYFVLDCIELNNLKKIDFFGKEKIICKDGYFGFNFSELVCKSCNSSDSYDDKTDRIACDGCTSTPDGYYCTTVNKSGCASEYFYDSFYGIKKNVDCSSENTNNTNAKKILSNFKEDINNINLRKIQANQTYTYKFEENGNASDKEKIINISRNEFLIKIKIYKKFDNYILFNYKYKNSL